MKQFLFGLLAAALALSACTGNKLPADNKSLDYESLRLNFALTGNTTWSEGTEFGIISSCTRDEQEGVSMSQNPIAKFKISDGQLVAASEDDEVIALKDDHNYSFVCVYPYPAAGSDIRAIPVQAPAVQSFGASSIPAHFAVKKAISVIPTIEFEMSSIFSTIDFYVPNDLRDGFETSLKSMDIRFANAADQVLAIQGSLNALTGEFTQSSSSDHITIDFGPSALELKEAYTKVSVLTAPFTIPEGGLSIVFSCDDDSTVDVKAFNADSELGKDIAAGEVYTSYLSGISDGIIPVQFPVVFPMGYPEGSSTGYNNSANEWLRDWFNDPACAAATKTRENWTGHHGTLYCKDQPQATMKWVWDEKIASISAKYFIEIANSATNKISVVGVKGIWTDDYFEFEIPVRKFAANSRVRLRMPLYTRTGPTFWEVLYLDGEEWKSTAKEDLEAYPGADIKAKATWAVPYLAIASTVDNEQSVDMTFENEVKSGKLYIRVKCADGTITSNNVNEVKIVEKPNVGAPFYFFNPGKRDDQHIYIELL